MSKKPYQNFPGIVNAGMADDPPDSPSSNERCEHSPLYTHDSVGREYRAPCPWCIQLELTRVVAERAAHEPSACPSCAQLTSWLRSLGWEPSDRGSLVRIPETKTVTNGGIKPTCPNCGHEPCAEWCAAEKPEPCPLPGCKTACRHSHEIDGPWYSPAAEKTVTPADVDRINAAAASMVAKMQPGRIADEKAVSDDFKRKTIEQMNEITGDRFAVETTACLVCKAKCWEDCYYQHDAPAGCAYREPPSEDVSNV